MQKPKMVNQTDDSDEINRGEKDELALSPQVRSLWLGRRDSNPRMPGPKPGALPLGHSPSSTCDDPFVKLITKQVC
jgi:hypothetical protein